MSINFNSYDVIRNIDKLDKKEMVVDDHTQHIRREYEKTRSMYNSRRNTDKKREWLYFCGLFEEVSINNELHKLHGKSIVRYNLKKKKLEKIMETRYGISGISIHNDYLYVYGIFEDKTMLLPGGTKINRMEVIRYDLKTKKIESIVEVGCVYSYSGGLIAHDNYLYISGGPIFISSNNEIIKIKGNGVIRYDLRNGKLERILDGADDIVCAMFIHDEYLYVGGWFNRIKSDKDIVELKDYGIVRCNLNTARLEKLIDEFDNSIYELYIHNDKIYVSGGFTETRTRDNKIKLNGKGVICYNLKTNRVEKVIDGSQSWTYGLSIYDNYLYVSGRFYNEEKDNYVNSKRMSIIKYNIDKNEVEDTVLVADNWISRLLIA